MHNLNDTYFTTSFNRLQETFLYKWLPVYLCLQLNYNLIFNKNFETISHNFN